MEKTNDTFIATPDVYLTKDWAKYVMKHVGMVKRMAYVDMFCIYNNTKLIFVKKLDKF